MLKSPQLVSKFVTSINPDCIKVSPFDSSIFCIGHYHQIQGEGVEGAISILNTKNVQQVSQMNSTPTAAVLHLCWINQRINGKQFILASCRNACLKIFEHVQNDKLIEHKTIEIKNKNLYCLYVDCAIYNDKIHVVVSTNQKKSVFFVLDLGFSTLWIKADIEQQYEFENHDYSVWCCRINPFSPNSFLSGDQISSLILYDIRQNPQKLQQNSKYSFVYSQFTKME